MAVTLGRRSCAPRQRRCSRGYASVCGTAHEDFDGTYSGLIQLSRASLTGIRHYAVVDVRGSSYCLITEVYGQFMYFAVFDPLLDSPDRPSLYRSLSMRHPTVRSHRFVWLTRLSRATVGFCITDDVWLVLCSTGISALAIGLIARSTGAGPTWGC